MPQDGIYHLGARVAGFVERGIVHLERRRIPGHIAVCPHFLEIIPSLEEMRFPEELLVFYQRVFTLRIIFEEDIDAPDLRPGPVAAGCYRLVGAVPQGGGRSRNLYIRATGAVPADQSHITANYPE